MAETGAVKLCTQVGYIKSYQRTEKSPPKWAWLWSRDVFIFLEISNNVSETMQEGSRAGPVPVSTSGLDSDPMLANVAFLDSILLRECVPDLRAEAEPDWNMEIREDEVLSYHTSPPQLMPHTWVSTSGVSIVPVTVFPVGSSALDTSAAGPEQDIVRVMITCLFLILTLGISEDTIGLEATDIKNYARPISKPLSLRFKKIKLYKRSYTNLEQFT